jgi:hypothetical protein
MDAKICKDLEDFRHELDLMQRRMSNFSKQYDLDFNPSERDFFYYHPECLHIFNRIWERLGSLEKKAFP